jgi:HlyD family secretion protein
MTYHNPVEAEVRRPSLAVRFARVAVLAVVLGAVWLVLDNRDEIRVRLASVFAAGSDEPVPVMSLLRTPYRMTVPALGEIVGQDSVPVPTPMTGRGSLRLAWLIPEGSFVRRGDVVVRFDSTDVRLNLETLRNALAANHERTKIADLQQQTDESLLQLDLKDAEAQYDYALTVLPQDETIFAKWDIIEAQIDARFAKERIDFLKAKGELQEETADSDQKILKIERDKAQTEARLAQQALDSLELRAPTTGLVVYRRDHRRDPQVGDESQPGQVLVEVANLDALQARLYVLERDAGELEPGQKVLLHLDAVPERDFNGVIRSVAATAQSLERNSPLRYFSCDVAIEEADEEMSLLRPGMELKADVILRQYDSCFVVPASAVTFKGDESLVYVQEGDQFTARPVEVGLGAHGEATILEGVGEGDLIATRNPFEERKLSLPDFGKSGPSSNRGRGPRVRMMFRR